MWFPTEEDAVQIFARHFEAKHRGGSATLARETAGRLKERGDHEGYKIWNRVADKIENLRQDRRLVQRRAMENA